MTGVGVMPTSGLMNGHMTSRDGTGVTPRASSANAVCHSGAGTVPLASNAYTLSCSVATKTTVRDAPPIARFATTSGCAYTSPSTRNAASLPKCAASTLRGVSTVSASVAPGARVVVLRRGHRRRAEQQHGRTRAAEGSQRTHAGLASFLSEMRR